MNERKASTRRDAAKAARFEQACSARRDCAQFAFVRGAAMNRKQRVLTIIALIAFVLIGACHYLGIKDDNSGPPYPVWIDPKEWERSQNTHYGFFVGGGSSGWETGPLVRQVTVPWFMLGVVYAGLFFFLADKKEKQ